jgi:archaellum component FlaC
MTQELSIRDRIGALLDGYMKTQDPSCLEEMEKILEDIDNELGSARLRQSRRP